MPSEYVRAGTQQSWPARVCLSSNTTDLPSSRCRSEGSELWCDQRHQRRGPHGRRHLVEARHHLSNLSALLPGCELATCPGIRRIALLWSESAAERSRRIEGRSAALTRALVWFIAASTATHGEFARAGLEQRFPEEREPKRRAATWLVAHWQQCPPLTGNISVRGLSRCDESPLRMRKGTEALRIGRLSWRPRARRRGVELTIGSGWNNFAARALKRMRCRRLS